jgi:MoaA/NifB/PqqE/SkfB family radical SAM enzyme
MRYDIEADWHLLNTCNYRCSYCFFPPDVLGSKLRLFATPQQWRSGFDAAGVTWLVHITGGEPSIYPDFVDLCEELVAKHFVSLNSNLTHSCLRTFAARIDPSRINFINAGLHLEERERRSGEDAFLRHADMLRRAGFPVLVSVVVTPPALARFEEAIALLRPIDLFPIPKLFRGVWSGATYPKAYNSSEKSRFREFSRRARDFYGADVARMAEPPSIDMLNDDLFVDGLPIYKGLMCEAGSRFVHILPNGDVFRCGGRDFQGNLLDGTFVRRKGLAPCSSEHCYYFCNKYAVRSASGVPDPKSRADEDRRQSIPDA